MTDAKKFALSDVLSVSTGVLFPNPAHEAPIDAVYVVMNHLSGQSLMTHHLAFLHNQAIEALVAQHPFLGELKVPERRNQQTDEQYLAVLDTWKNEMADRFGEEIEVREDAERFSTVGLMTGMPDHLKVIGVVTDDK